MKVKTLQILWHNKDPVFSLDFHPSSNLLATAGGDKEIRLWEVHVDADGSPAVAFLSTVSGHSSAVNCVRFSPTGGLLAAAGDKGQITLWRPDDPGATRQRAAFGMAEEDVGDGPVWKHAGTLAGGHNADVQDVCWSPDGSALVTGSVENLCILWNIPKRRAEARLQHHGHFVQGVAWDPRGQFIVSQSNDRTCKVYGQRPPAAGAKKAATASAASDAQNIKDFVMHATVSKRALESSGGPLKAASPARPDDHGAVDDDMNNVGSGAAQRPGTAASTQQAGAAVAAPDGAAAATAVRLPDKHSLFHDESIATFFRRLSWSPDGSLLAMPTGTFRRDNNAATSNATYLFLRGDWSAPAYQLPALHKPSVVVRFCPTLFALRPMPAGARSTQAAQENAQTAAAAGVSPPPAVAAAAAAGDESFVALPYRMVFAVATTDSVFLYDTQSPVPLALLGSLHFAAITDLSWSHDGTFLAASSQDGFCTLVAFQPGDLGQPLTPDQLPSAVAGLVSRTAAHTLAHRTATKDAEAAAAKAAKAPPAAAAVTAAAIPTAGVAQAAAPAAAAGAASPGSGLAPAVSCHGAACAAAPLPAVAVSSHTTACGSTDLAGTAAAPPPQRRRLQPQLVVGGTGAAGPLPSHLGRPDGAAPAPKRVESLPVQVPAAGIPSGAPAVAVVMDRPSASRACDEQSAPSAGAVAGAAPQPRRVQPQPVRAPQHSSPGLAAVQADGRSTCAVTPTAGLAPTGTAYPSGTAVTPVSGSTNSLRPAARRIAPTPVGANPTDLPQRTNPPTTPPLFSLPSPSASIPSAAGASPPIEATPGAAAGLSAAALSLPRPSPVAFSHAQPPPSARGPSCAAPTAGGTTGGTSGPSGRHEPERQQESGRDVPPGLKGPRRIQPQQLSAPSSSMVAAPTPSTITPGTASVDVTGHGDRRTMTPSAVVDVSGRVHPQLGAAVGKRDRADDGRDTNGDGRDEDGDGDMDDIQEQEVSVITGQRIAAGEGVGGQAAAGGTAGMSSIAMLAAMAGQLAASGGLKRQRDA